jgi:hypothetical protein
LASDRSVTLVNRNEFCRRWDKLRIEQLMSSLAAIRCGFNALLNPQIVFVFSPLELECLICGDSEISVDRMKERFHFQDGTEEDRERFITVLGPLTWDERFHLLAFCAETPSRRQGRLNRRSS